jgi:hypothetical protein
VSRRISTKPSLLRAVLMTLLLVGFFFGGLFAIVRSSIVMVETLQPRRTINVEVLDQFVHVHTGKHAHTDYGVVLRLDDGHTKEVKSRVLYDRYAFAGLQTAEETQYLHRIVAVRVNGERVPTNQENWWFYLAWGIGAFGLVIWIIRKFGIRGAFERLRAAPGTYRPKPR